MFNFMNLKSRNTGATLTTAPPFPVEYGKHPEGGASTPKVQRGKVLLWAYLRVLSELGMTATRDRCMSINALYEHFLAHSRANREEVTRRQFGTELHRWIRDNHLPLRTTKPHASAAFVEGIDLPTLNLIFQN